MADDVSLEQQVKCVERELRMRHQVFGRRVAAGKMKQEQMDREIREMQAVLKTVQRAATAEKPDLFSG